MIRLGLLVIAACVCGLVVLFPNKTRYVNGLIACFLAGSAATTCLQLELWPLSSYPMFANRQGQQFKRLRLYGVPVTPGGNEIPLVWQHAEPFGEPDLADAFQHLVKAGDQRRLRLAVNDCLGRYERRRLAGFIDGPPLRGVRLYSVEWNLKRATAVGVAPETKTLIAEMLLESTTVAVDPG